MVCTKIASRYENMPKKQHEVCTITPLHHPQTRTNPEISPVGKALVTARKQTPKFHSCVQVQLGLHSSFPLCPRTLGAEAGRQSCLGKDSSSASPPLLMVKAPCALRELRAAKELQSISGGSATGAASHHS